MKSRLIYFLVTLMIVSFTACSSSNDSSEPSKTVPEETDEPLKPSITVPAGNENYFVKNIDFPSSKGEKTITFCTNMDWKVEVPQNIDWCKVSPQSGKAGTQNITVSVSGNETYDDRSAVLRLSVGDSTKTIIVNQKQLDALTLTADKFEVPQVGGTINVEVKSNIDFTYSIPEEFKSWIHESSSRGTRALTSHQLAFSIDASEEYEKREGQIVIKSADKEEIITVYQVGGGLLTLTSNEIAVGSEGGTAEIVVNSNFDYKVEIPNVDWVKQLDATKTRAISSHVLKLDIAENKEYSDRTATVRVYDKNSDLSETIKIVQTQANAILVDGEKSYSFDENGGVFTVSLNSNVSYDVSINGAWITETSSPAQSRALSKSSHTFKVEALKDNSERSGSITFKNETTKTTETITITQKPSLYFELSSVGLEENGSKKLKYTNNLEDKNVTFSSSNTDVATVSEDGTAKAVSRGKATITITSADGKHSDECEVTVKSVIDNITVYCSSASVMSINGLIRYGSQLGWTLKNNSSSDITLVSMQLVDGVSGNAGNEMEVNTKVAAGETVGYTTTIGLAGIHAPVTCKFKIECNGNTYTVEAIYKN